MSDIKLWKVNVPRRKEAMFVGAETIEEAHLILNIAFSYDKDDFGYSAEINEYGSMWTNIYEKIELLGTGYFIDKKNSNATYIYEMIYVPVCTRRKFLDSIWQDIFNE